MEPTWLVLVPPVLVVVLALLTRRVVFSLIMGILSSSLILHDFAIKPTLAVIAQRIWVSTELGNLASWELFWSSWYLFICLFLVMLGILVTMVGQSGGAQAYGDIVGARLKSTASAERSSLMMSLFFFIDDYFSSLTVGSVMQPITDKFKVPRVKLALLINAVAAPLVVLSPISSWSAYIVMQLRQSGVQLTKQAGTLVQADPFRLYMQIIPFVAYAVIMLVALWYVVLYRASYGIIADHEATASKNGNLFGGKISVVKRGSSSSKDQLHDGSMWDFLSPIIFLLGIVFAGIAIYGFDKIPVVLFFSSLITVILGFAFLLARKRFELSRVPAMLHEGAMEMLPSIMVLVLIWTLSSLLKDDLRTGDYLANLLIGRMNIAFLPSVFFLVSTLISATMGSAWGTIGIMVPIGVPLLVSFVNIQTPVTPDQLVMLFPLLGAIVSGAVSGNHISPIADIMLMSATSAGAYHLDLVKAQVSLAIPVVIASAFSFLVAGFMIQTCGIFTTAAGALGVGVGACVIMIQALNFWTRKKLNN